MFLQFSLYYLRLKFALTIVTGGHIVIQGSAAGGVAHFRLLLLLLGLHLDLMLMLLLMLMLAAISNIGGHPRANIAWQR